MPTRLGGSPLTTPQAIARAVYARCEIVLLDTCFSALDGKTESRVVENLLGAEGLFKKMGTTVFLITNSGKSQTLFSQKGQMGVNGIQLRISTWQTG